MTNKTNKNEEIEREPRDEYIGIKVTKSEREKFDRFVKEKDITLSAFARNSMSFFVEKDKKPEIYVYSETFKPEVKGVNVDLSPIEKKLASMEKKIETLSANVEARGEPRAADLLSVIDKVILNTVDETIDEAINGDKDMSAVFGVAYSRVMENITEELAHKKVKNYLMDKVRETIDRRLILK